MFHQNNWPIDHLHHQETKSIWFTKSFLISWFNTESAFPWLTKISCHYQGHIPMTLAIIHSFTKEPVIYIRWKIEWKQIQALSFIAGGPRGALKWNFSIFEKIMTDHPAKRPTDKRKVSLPISVWFFTQRHIKKKTKIDEQDNLLLTIRFKCCGHSRFRIKLGLENGRKEIVLALRDHYL